MIKKNYLAVLSKPVRFHSSMLCIVNKMMKSLTNETVLWNLTILNSWKISLQTPQKTFSNSSTRFDFASWLASLRTLIRSSLLQGSWKQQKSDNSDSKGKAICKMRLWTVGNCKNYECIAYSLVYSTNLLMKERIKI